VSVSYTPARDAPGTLAASGPRDSRTGAGAYSAALRDKGEEQRWVTD